MPIKVEDLPEVLPDPDVNKAQLIKLRIQKIAQESGHFVANTQVCITGHVDSGKSSLTANFLKHCGVLQEKALKEEENKIIARKGEDYKPSPLEIATRSVEKGKEAKDRGMTIEVKAHELPLVMQAIFEVDSADYKEMIDLLTFLKKPYEIVDSVDRENKPCKAIQYKDRIVLLDSPGHRDFIYATNSAIAVADWQFALFPSSSGVGEAGNDQFLTALDKGSTSMGHSRLGVSQNNYMTFILSKADFNTSDSNKEKDSALRRVLSKNLGIKANKQIVIPSSSKDMNAHNIFKLSDLDCLKYYTPQKVDLSIKDYRNPTRVYPCSVTVNSAIDLFPYILPQICVKGTYDNKGTMIFITEIANNTKHGTIVIGQVLNGVASIGDVVKSVHLPENEYRIESMEQFLKPVEHSPVKSFIGMKLKPLSKNKTQVSRHDLLHFGYPADNIPKSSQYMEARLLFFPPESGSKTKECKLGVEFTMVTVLKATMSIVNVFSYKSGKEAEVKDTPDAPITSWPLGNTIAHCVIKFKHDINLPIIKQSVYGHSGNFLSSKHVAGSIKLVNHIKDGESVDRPLQALKSKKSGKK